jgi:hypothetical protein
VNLWRRRDFQAAAYRWRNERIGQLQAEARILEALLDATRNDLATMRRLHGEHLAIRFGWESPAEVEATLEPAREFTEEIQRIWIEGEHNLKPP